ncbi:MAG TPA: DUF222 domain-containing protein [Marmoricola sp.]|nr:DUF222 domain-containing protein [Marmoricola sp.]
MTDTFGVLAGSGVMVRDEVLGVRRRSVFADKVGRVGWQFRELLGSAPADFSTVDRSDPWWQERLDPRVGAALAAEAILAGDLPPEAEAARRARAERRKENGEPAVIEPDLPEPFARRVLRGVIERPEPAGIARMVTLDTAELASYDRVLLVKAWDAALAWLHAQRLGAAALVAGEATVDSSGTYEIGTEEVRLALTLTRREADAVVDLARALHARLPETRAALERGAISVEHARIVVRGTEQCTDDECALIEAGLARSGALPAAGKRTDRTTSSLRDSVRRQVLRVRGPEPDEDRARAAARRNVRVDDAGDGMTDVVINTPAVGGQTIWLAIDARARAMREHATRQGIEDKRGINAWRADAAVDLASAYLNGGAAAVTALGSADATVLQNDKPSENNPLLPAVPEGQEPLPGLAAVQDVLAAGPQVSVPWAGAPTAHGRAVLPVLVFSGDALLHPDGDNAAEPALLRGHGPVPAAVARDLILAEKRWRVALVDRHYQLLAVDTYEPTQVIRDWVMTKYERCSTPGCTNPAIRCDLDHEQAHAQGGPTSADNLPPRCRFCHQLKTMGITSIDTEHDETGETRRVLRMPSGHTYPLVDPPLTEQQIVDAPTATTGWGDGQEDEKPPF